MRALYYDLLGYTLLNTDYKIVLSCVMSDRMNVWTDEYVII